MREEQLKERLGERFRELDIPLLVEWPDGRRAALVFVVEEETDPKRFSVLRLAHYCLDIAELLDTRRVVPVVVFLRGGPAERKLDLGGDEQTYLRFRFLSIELSTLPYREHRDSRNIVVRLNLPNMNYAPQERVEVYAAAVRGLASLEPDPERQRKYLDFVDIYADLDDQERKRYEREYPDEVQTMTSFSERFEAKGRQQGEAVALMRVMRRKFGELPEPARQRIEAADAQTLLEWIDRIFTAESIDEVIH
ncbi:hypothetical protein THSYN_16030 [Candidatus Thiodictyon syntrophicum]|uniref:DUF4351 domain-containing protein n=1 Tax=Candidatus Thiodictyon syntrophicum TaxID=1166950 RepID=A0A2K8U9U1_9GAMM|nr:hypothetical protein THSYN_16030 [Candidatus Thiodictyon syntrophicum]